MDAVKDLVVVLEDEVRVGEDLLHNLFAQHNAILAWNASVLLERLTEKELLLYRLANIEAQQKELTTRVADLPAGQELSLTELLVRLPATPEREALKSLRDRAGKVYGRVQTEERHLAGLLENLLGHMREMLSPLSHTPVHLYGRSGTTSLSRPASGLIQGKA